MPRRSSGRLTCMTSVHAPSPSTPIFTNLNIQATHPPLVREQTRRYPTGRRTPNLAAVPIRGLWSGCCTPKHQAVRTIASEKFSLAALSLEKGAAAPCAVARSGGIIGLPAVRGKADDLLSVLTLRSSVTTHDRVICNVIQVTSIQAATHQGHRWRPTVSEGNAYRRASSHGGYEHGMTIV